MIDRTRRSCDSSPRLSRRTLTRSLAATLGAAALHWPLDATLARAPAAGVGTGPLRLGANENPNGLGLAAREALQASLSEANRYPGESVQRLLAEIARVHDVPREHVLLAPGSGEILRAATLAFTGPSKALVAASPTFEAPGRAAVQVGAPVRAVPVLATGALDLVAMAGQAAGAGLFFVCNPNNPTGGASPAAAVSELVASVRRVAPDAVVLVDEAYFEYVDDPSYGTAVPLTRTDPRVMVSRTFSKIHGMAGMRVGYAIAQPETLAALRRHSSQGTLSGVSAAAALASFQDLAHVKQQVALNREARAFTRSVFERAGYRVLPSEANFLMVDVKREVSSLQGACRQTGVLIARPFPPLTTWARISIGAMDEMKRAVELVLPLLSAPATARADDRLLRTFLDGESC